MKAEDRDSSFSSSFSRYVATALLDTKVLQRKMVALSQNSA
jgi:hypothetical protein